MTTPSDEIGTAPPVGPRDRLRALLQLLLGASSARETNEVLRRLRRIEAGLDALTTAGAGRKGSEPERLLTEINRQVRGIQSSARRTDGNVQTLIRRAYLDTPLDPPHDLLTHRFRIQSQNDEDGITLALFRRVGVVDRRFVELGAGTNGGNSGFLAQECGWSGLLVEANEARVTRLEQRFNTARVSVKGAWITRESVNDLLTEHECTGDIDLVSIDIDGNDYWVWEALTAARPRVVIVEFNAAFGATRQVVVPYDAAFSRETRELPHAYYGASLGALAGLAERKGYRLVLVEPRGINAYFVRNDVGPDLEGVTAEAAYHQSAAGMGAAKVTEAFPNGDAVAAFQADGLPLVDFEPRGDIDPAGSSNQEA